MVFPFPRLLLAFSIFFVLLAVASAQAPAPEGADSFFLGPLAIPPVANRPSPAPGRSVAPEVGFGFGSASSGDDVEGGRRPRPGVTEEGFGQGFAEPPVAAVPPPSARVCRRVRFRILSGQCTSAFESTWAEAQRVQFSYLASHSSTVPTGFGLKSAREISNILSDQRQDTLNEHGLNELFVFFGQFVDHNLVATPADGESFPIIVPPGDAFFTAGSRLHFKRSTRGFTGEGLNERPINVLSSTLDLSAVYGVNNPRNEFLLEKDRSGQLTGKLKTSAGNLLPFNDGGFNNAPNSQSNRFYLTGDHRANEHPVLTALHTIFVREHNRLVDKINSAVPPFVLFQAGQKRIYQWARQINIAQFQKIIYEEFLPAILGKRIRYRGYRRLSDPTVSDIFAGAAYRVGHTMVGNTISRRSAYTQLPPLSMQDMFFRPHALANSEEIANLIRGAFFATAQEIDLQVHDVLRNQLFRNVPGEEGFDLVALNIQRGRDHALPTYNQIRRIFGMIPARTFFDISRNPFTAEKLSNAYDGNVDAVEAWPGMVAEDKVRGAGMGSTMIRVWEVEFGRLSAGDQFFYLQSRKSLPSIANLYLQNCVRDILNSRKKLFREIIIRNTGIGENEIPDANIFRAF